MNLPNKQIGTELGKLEGLLVGCGDAVGSDVFVGGGNVVGSTLGSSTSRDERMSVLAAIDASQN